MDKLNFFGFVPEFYVHGGHNKTSSSVNASFSIAFLAITSWLLITNSQVMFNKENPSTIKSDTFQPNPEMIPISPTTFNVGFGLEDSIYNLYKKESIYHVRTVYSIFERRFNKTSGNVDVLHEDIPLETEDCTLNHFGEAGPQFADIQLKGLYCFKTKQPHIEKLEIGGKFISDMFKIIRVFLTPCVNGTSNVICETPEVIDSHLATTKFNIFYTSLGITPENYEHPYVSYKDNKYYTIGQSFGTKIVFNPKPIDIIDSVGLFSKTDELQTFYQLDFVTTDLSFKNFKYFMQFNIEPSQMKTIYKRNYMGLEDVLALVNGTTAVLFLIFTYLIKPYSKYLYFMRILNQLYDVRQEKPKEKPMKKSKELLKLSTSETKGNMLTSENHNKPDNPNGDISRIDGNTSFSQIKLNQKDESIILENNPRTNELKETTLETNPNTGTGNQRYGIDIGIIDVEAEIKKLDARKTEMKSSMKNSTKTFMKLSTFGPMKESTPGKTQPDTLENPFTTVTPNMKQSTKTLAIETLNPEIFNESDSDEDFSGIQLEVQEDDQNDVPHLDQLKAIDLRDSLDSTAKGETKKKIIETECVPVTIKPDRKRSILKNMITKPIEFTFIDYILSVFCKERIKGKISLLSQGESKIKKRLDIENILLRLEEVEKLKNFLLDKDQLYLFNHLPKPILRTKPIPSSPSKCNKKGKEGSTKAVSEENTEHSKYNNPLRRSNSDVFERRKGGHMIDIEKLSTAYENLEGRYNKTNVDKRLIDAFREYVCN